MCIYNIYHSKCRCTARGVSHITVRTVCIIHSNQLMRLYAKYREAEVHRKALVFQKDYLKSQVDAFFQTQQVALIMMTDMGAPPEITSKSSKSRGDPLRRMKIAVHVVTAVFRFQYVVRRKNQYIQSYSCRVEREKATVLVKQQRADGIRPVLGVHPAMSSYNTPLLPALSSFPPPTSMSPPDTTHTGTIKPVSKPPPHTSQPTGRSEHPHLSSLLPSLARLQAKLSGTVH